MGGREGGLGGRECRDNYGGFTLLYGRNQHSIVKILKANKHKKKTDLWLPGDGSGMGKGGKEGVQKAEEAVRGNGYTH